MIKDNRPSCVLCGARLSEQELETCREQAERFDQQLLCTAHQRRFSGCPGLRHRPLG